MIFSNRYALFGLAILLGFVAAVYYGWAARPVTVRDAEPTLLREDFRADYVLMVAEAYEADHQVERAIGALGFLSQDQESYNPLVFVSDAMAFGVDAGYSVADLERLQILAAALKTFDPGFAATPTP
ncbi:MAG: hypothetical protein M1347_05080 [Chloroflexi bacterium]|nr:hypothetical protein [Chloroflexota bacterium]